MRQPNPFLQLALPRAQTVRSAVESMIWQELTALRCEAGPASAGRTPLAQARRRSGDMGAAPPDPAPAGRFQFRWYRILPPEGGWPADAFLRWRHDGESTLYVHGAPYAGFDRRHEFHRLPENPGEPWAEVMHMEAAQGFAGAALCRRHGPAWQAHHDLEVLLDLARLRTEHLQEKFGSGYADAFGYRPSPEYLDRATRRLLRLLDRAATAFERGGLHALTDHLQAAREEFPADGQAVHLVATAQAHLDPVHMWPETVGDFKVVHTFATAARLMDEYPELTFQFSQPATYSMVARQEPELMDRVRARLQQGRWEMEGAMHVESDVQMPCGEALARAFLVGQQITREFTGQRSTVLWLPDTFGFPACLPQVMRQCGVGGFWTTKMHWNPITHFPHSSFRWKGHDGSEVLVHLAQHHMGYMLNGLPSQMRNVECIHRQSDVHAESIAPIGFGDGGGGITAEQVERVRRIGDLYGVPPTRFGRVRDFFDRMKERTDDLPRYQGELYLEYHRGVLTSRRRIKELYRACERELQRLEAAHAVLGLGPVPERFWRRVAFMQFHDILTGSHVQQPYEQICTEMEELVDELRGRTREALASGEEDARECLFNPLPLRRRWLHRDEESGELTPVELPPLAGVPLKQQRNRPADASVTAAQTSLANDRVVASFDDHGRITRLSVDGRGVRLREPAGDLLVYRELPAMFDVWNIDRPSITEGTPAGPADDACVQRDGPHRARVQFTRPLGRSSSVTVTYSLDSGATALRVRYEIDWQEPRAMLKAHFPTQYAASHARFGTPFGSVLRPAQPGMPDEEAQWESAGSRWACVFDEGERDGLCLVTKDSYGFACYDGDLNVTLVRSPIPPEADRKRLGAVLVRDAAAYGEDPEEKLFTDIGRHTVEIAVGLYDADSPRGELPAALADTLFTPPVPYRGRPVTPPDIHLQNADHLLPCWVQPAERGTMVVRLHEVLGRHGTARLAQGTDTSRLVDLSGEIAGKAQEGRIEFGPYQVLGWVVG